MKLIDQTLQQFINQVASSSPAPGGGSIAALQGACGAGLTKMALELTITKKKFLSLDMEKQAMLTSMIGLLQTQVDEFLELIDEDTDAFQLIMQAFSLAKTTEEEKKVRKQAIFKGTIQAIAVPKKVISLCFQAIKIFDQVFPYLNPNTLSDQGVALLCFSSSIEGAAYNVLINLPSLEDDLQKKELQSEALQAISFANEAKSKHIDSILKSLAK